MGIRGFESRLERAVDGAFSRLFRTGLSPVEFGRKLEREMNAHRTVGVDGRTIVPNSYEFVISDADAENLSELLGTLRRELADAAREHARDERYAFIGPVEVDIITGDRQRPGVLTLHCHYAEHEGGLPPGSLLLPTGDRVPLGESVITIGRANDCTIVLADPNVSRHHAEVRPGAEGFVVIDKGSTNGTKVNGSRVSEHLLRDGDEVSFGNTVMHFQAS